MTLTPNQVARDIQLLNTTRDYFYFVTTFSELISTSATHIYHSALELSPLSSVIRKFYYYQRPHPSPKVVIGIPDSWEPRTSVSAHHSYYLSSTWSPCGQSIAAVAEGVIRVWDALSLKPLSTFQSAKPATKFRCGLAFSPDGYSLAGCSEAGIVIWDTQTGGVVKEIECEITGSGLELVWALDGKTISTISPRVSETLTMHIYNTATGTKLTSVTLQSRYKPYIWAYDKSFQIATTTAWDQMGSKINIFEVGSTLTKIKSFPLKSYSHFGCFSPTTYRVSVSVPGDHNHSPRLLVLDISNSESLLQETGSYWHSSFSSDASLFGASTRDHLHIWRYTSGYYTQWRKFQQTTASLQFSPTSSSILAHAGTLLHVIHSDYSPATLTIESVTTAHSMPRDAYSPHGTYIATTHCGESAITITNLHSQNPSPSQFIDTNWNISEIVLTGNVLLVKGLDAVMAWLLTEDGMVDGVFGNRRANQDDSLWVVSLKDMTSEDTSPHDKNPGFWARLLQRGHTEKQNADGYLGFSVRDGIAALGNPNRYDIHVYQTETGEILKHDKPLLHPEQTWYRFNNPHQDDCDLYHHDSYKHHKPPECDWPVSQRTLQEGWVKDPEGKHRLWLHPHWRTIGNDANWLSKVTTLRLKNQSELVIIKF